MEPADAASGRELAKLERGRGRARAGRRRVVPADGGKPAARDAQRTSARGPSPFSTLRSCSDGRRSASLSS
jgi:hypothetical protein